MTSYWLISVNLDSVLSFPIKWRSKWELKVILGVLYTRTYKVQKFAYLSNNEIAVTLSNNAKYLKIVLEDKPNWNLYTQSLHISYQRTEYIVAKPHYLILTRHENNATNESKQIHALYCMFSIEVTNMERFVWMVITFIKWKNTQLCSEVYLF